jgi:hypothetical protein
MGYTPLTDQRLRVGKATSDGLKENPSIVDLDSKFVGAAPLWFYILAEAQDQWRQTAEAQQSDEQREIQPTLLGPVGGRIVGEVMVGLLANDPNSFLSDPTWKPHVGNPQAASIFDRFTVGDLIELPLSA